ncbi:hypothetical protein DET53_101791 [Vibrio parahaemolyticus]|jgi:hypothetical protein|nr:hypothetical protein DET53_101791 [Vibrio parahaemolyticus]
MFKDVIPIVHKPPNTSTLDWIDQHSRHNKTTSPNDFTDNAVILVSQLLGLVS